MKEADEGVRHPIDTLIARSEEAPFPLPVLQNLEFHQVHQFTISEW